MVGAREAKSFLLDELVKGHVVLPMAKDCVGFDYGGGGCPGHDVDEDAAPAARAAGDGPDRSPGSPSTPP